MPDIALFPIPECVSYPGTIVPLHVFEPRYRAMVDFCIEHNMPMAVCHTQKEIHPAKSNQKPDEALQSNQATYKPYEVFSAGMCELLETLDDGRMLINVHIEARYRALEAKQLLPFSIYQCEEYMDIESEEQNSQTTELLRQKILRRLTALTAADEMAQSILQSDNWIEMSVSEFSFLIMQILQLDAGFKQRVLEARSAQDRLNLLFKQLND